MLNTLVIANSVTSDNPELLIPYHEILQVTGLSKNKFIYRPKSLKPIDLMLAEEEGKMNQGVRMSDKAAEIHHSAV
jgi:hypothetical protein